MSDLPRNTARVMHLMDQGQRIERREAERVLASGWVLRKHAKSVKEEMDTLGTGTNTPGNVM